MKTTMVTPRKSAVVVASAAALLWLCAALDGVHVSSVLTTPVQPSVEPVHTASAPVEPTRAAPAQPRPARASIPTRAAAEALVTEPTVSARELLPNDPILADPSPTPPPGMVATPAPPPERDDDEPPPGRTRIDPAKYGYSSVGAMEQDLSKKLQLPADQELRVWGEERHGKHGVAMTIRMPDDE